MPGSILDQVRAAALKRLLFLPHGIRQMSRPDRMITTAEVEIVVTQASWSKIILRTFEAIAVSSWVSEKKIAPFMWHALPRTITSRSSRRIYRTQHGGHPTLKGGCSYGMHPLQRSDGEGGSAVHY